MNLRDWHDIEEHFQSTLVLGNGASIAISDKFNYKSLLETARKKRPITPALDGLFEAMHTKDFELVLEKLAIAQDVNTTLGIVDGKTHEAYEEIRRALIETVQEIHPMYTDVEPDLKLASEFMSRFKTVISLNYDLLVYWAMMLGNESMGNHFKDCFDPKRFRRDWHSLQEPYKANGATLVFYPHGSLALVSQNDGEEAKVTSNVIVRSSLLDQIIGTWDKEINTPLFVAEGTSQQKLRAIQRSRYLSVVYDEVLTQPGDSVAIYGWSLDENDKHVAERICKGRKRIAISVYRNATSNGDADSWCESVEKKIHAIDKDVEIDFYDAESAGCWIHPAAMAAL